MFTVGAPVGLGGSECILRLAHFIRALGIATPEEEPQAPQVLSPPPSPLPSPPLPKANNQIPSPPPPPSPPFPPSPPQTVQRGVQHPPDFKFTLQKPQPSGVVPTESIIAQSGT